MILCEIHVLQKNSEGRTATASLFSLLEMLIITVLFWKTSLKGSTEHCTGQHSLLLKILTLWGVHCGCMYDNDIIFLGVD
jgi:hypothetical protein